MGWVWAILLFGSGAFMVAVWHVVQTEQRRGKQRNATWALVAEQFGLEFTPAPPPARLVGASELGPRIRGTCDGFTVDVRGTDQKLTMTGLEASLRIGPREPTGLFDLLSAPLRDPELVVGDPTFEGQVVIESYVEVVTFAALDRGTREVLSHAMGLGMRVVNGELVCAIGGPSAAKMAERLELALDVARRLSVRGPEVRARLLSLATNDPAPRVRTRALASLIALYPDALETAQARAHVGLELVEPVLLAHLLESSRGQAVVFDALGAIASLSAVERLLQLDCDRSAERARAAAIAKIQKRLGLGEGGQLSLAQDAPESGSLSTAAHDSGQLRIADREGEER